MKPSTSRRIYGLALAAGLLLAVNGRELSAQANEPMGTYKLNVAKSTYGKAAAPKSSSVTYTAVDKDKGVKVVVDVLAATGDKLHWEYTANFDGKDYPVTGNPDADTAALKRINATTVEIMNKKAGKPTVTNTRVLSSDGKTVTVTTKGTNSKGEPVNTVQVFEK